MTDPADPTVKVALAFDTKVEFAAKVISPVIVLLPVAWIAPELETPEPEMVISSP